MRHLLFVLLASLPLLVTAQLAQTHAFGLRVSGSYEDYRTENRFRALYDLSYRLPIGQQWSAELTAGYWRGSVENAATTTLGRQRPQQFQAAVTLQREWQFADPQWSSYVGAGIGVLHYNARGVGGALDGERLGETTNLTLQGIMGLRYRLEEAPLEFDFSLRPSYEGRGFGIVMPVSIGLRYRFGGR